MLSVVVGADGDFDMGEAGFDPLVGGGDPLATLPPFGLGVDALGLLVASIWLLDPLFVVGAMVTRWRQRPGEWCPALCVCFLMCVRAV